jgi:6-phosphogluconolactonase
MAYRRLGKRSQSRGLQPTGRVYEIVVCSDTEKLNRRTAEQFVRLATESVTATGRFTVALSGGSTPRALYPLLASETFLPLVPWAKVYFFWGDERCVPPDHPESNYGMARMMMLEKVPVPKENVYRMPTEKGNARTVAAEYEKILRAFFGFNEGQQPRFDLILLGMGEDGHTASLFPGTAALKERGTVTANNIQRLGTDRITLTIPAINQAAHIVFLVSGSSKAAVLKEVLEGQDQPARLPSQSIQPVEGELLFLVDRAAASELTSSGDQQG